MERKTILNEFRHQFGRVYSVYDASIILSNKDFFLLAKDGSKKYLFILSGQEILKKFTGEVIGKIKDRNNIFFIKKADTSNNNLKIIKEIFSWLNPVACGFKTSFGSGDRLGIVTPAHINAFEKNKAFFPFLCQQSVRELHKRSVTWQQVINDTIWGVFESGYKRPFGADADHIKEIKDINDAIDAGYSMFTIDPSDYIPNDSNDNFNKKHIEDAFESIPERKEIEKIYLGKKFIINQGIFEFSEETLPVVAAYYLEAIKHTINCYEIVKQRKKESFDFEVSMDETVNPISPLAHIFITNELQRNGVNFHNLALRFPGEWQKGVDFKGNLWEFINDIKVHAEIARKFGGYKLSLHSGSEKFSTYKIFSEETRGLYHVKTSGTSWLASIRTIALTDPILFKDIYNFAADRFEEDKKSYSISTRVSDISDIKNTSEQKYGPLLECPPCRQMFHVTFGSILSMKEGSEYVFRDKIYKSLFKNEEIHYKNISENIGRHLDLLNSN